MSGIAGIISHKENIDTVSILKSMLSTIKHRGPDYREIFISSNWAIGITKSISGINKVESSIATNNDETITILLSGEIYNSSELLRYSDALVTKSIPEQLLNLYQKYGVSFLELLNGQFVLCICDSTKNEILLARDKVGISPIYYSSINDSFVFASEMKSIFECPGFSAKISPTALKQCATFWSILAPNTIFENVFELPGGHYIILKESSPSVVKYWDYPICSPLEYTTHSIHESIEELDALLKDAVKIRVSAADNFGAYLSGGLDSSVTTSYIKELYPDINLDTFSISFENANFDESSYQQLAVDYFKTNHSKVICSDNDIVNNFEQVIWFAENPLLRTGPIPMYLLSKLARKSSMQTIISGEGADEVLGGYNIFKEALIREFWAHDPSSQYRPLLLQKLYPYLSQMRDSNNLALKMFFGYKLTEVSSPVYSHLLRWNNTSRISNLFSTYLQEKVQNYNPVEELSQSVEEKLKGHDLLPRAQWIEAKTFMSSYLLSSQGDRMAMANSIEARYPFLDHRVIELGMRLKNEYKLKGLDEKYILKRMVKGRIPSAISNRSKQPYRAPSTNSFLSENSERYLHSNLLEEQISSSGIFDYEKVSQLIHRLRTASNSSEVDNMALSFILSTQALHSLFVENKSSKFKNNESIKIDNTVYDISMKLV